MASNSSSKLADRLAALIGRDRTRSSIGHETAVAEVVVEPASVAEICELVRMCEMDRIAIAPIGAARSLSQIRRSPVAIGLSLTRLAKIIAYEPDDMTVVAEAGLTVGDLNAATAASRQRLAVDPCNPEQTTLGALIGASHAGPLRLSEGTARDLLIGIRFVGHRGAMIHGGGRVVKNVAGYDLMKVIGGAYGTLGIVTEATFKMRPIPQQYCLATIEYDRIAEAFAAASTLNDLLPLSHVEVLSPAFGTGLELSDNFILMAGFSGNPQEIEYQAGKILDFAGARADILKDDPARVTYQRLRDLDFLSQPLAAQISVPPSRLARTIDACGCEFRAHAGSGVAQIVMTNVPVAEDARATIARWRETAHSQQGHLRMIAAAGAIRDSIEYFDTPNTGALNLMRRLKAAFDPAGIFNPGCFVGGI